MKLKITQVIKKNEATSKTGNPLFIMDFLGTDEQNQSKVYTTFSKSMYEMGDKVVGQEFEGEVSETEYQGTTQYRFNKAGEGKKSFGKSPEERAEIIRQNSVGNAIEFYKLSPVKDVTIKMVIATADAFFNYCKNGNVE